MSRFATNAELGELRRLCRRRSFRVETGCFVTEGPTATREAIDSFSSLVRLVFVADETDPIVAAALAFGCEVAVAQRSKLEAALSTTNPMPVAAVLTQPLQASMDVLDGRSGVWMVCHGLNDPGNMGAVIRSAAGLGASAVIGCGESVDFWNPKVVRASATGVLRIPLANGIEIEEVRSRRRCVGLVASGGAPIWDADLRSNDALILGSETHGLPAALVAEFDQLVTVPLHNEIESLNASIAAALVLAEYRRRGDMNAKGNGRIRQNGDL